MKSPAAAAAVALAFALAGVLAPPPDGAAAARTLAPGVTHRQQIRLTPHGPVVLNVITTPRPGGLYKLTPLVSNDTLPAPNERVTSMVARASTAATVAAINGDSSDPKTGLPIGIQLRSGLLEHAPYEPRSSIGVAADGTLRVEKVSLYGYWQGMAGQRALGINRANPKNGTTLYTSAYGPTTPPGAGAAAVVLGDFPGARPSVDSFAHVTQIAGAEPVPIPGGGAVLIAAGDDAAPLREEAPLGQELTIRLALTPAWTDVADAIGGGPALLAGGKPVFDAGEEFAPVDLGRRLARSAVGQKADGTIVMVTVDGGRPGYSTGLTNFELAQSMARLGVVTAAGLGSGHEASMAFEGRLLSRPSGRSGERKVTNALAMLYDGVLAPPPSRSIVSPNGDGKAESVRLSYELVRSANVSVTLIGPDGGARFSEAGQKSPGLYSTVWNGRGPDGASEVEGKWSWNVMATDDLGRASSDARSFRLDNTLGRLRIGPSPFAIRAPKVTTRGAMKARKLAIRVRVGRRARVSVRIYGPRGAVVRTVRSGTVRAGMLKASWDGRDRKGKLVRSGRYRLRVTAKSGLGKVELSRDFSVRRLAR